MLGDKVTAERARARARDAGGRRRRAGRGDDRARAPPGRRAGAGVLDDEGAAHPRARPRPRQRDRDGGAGAGAADEERGLRRVLRRVVGGAEAGVERAGDRQPAGAPAARRLRARGGRRGTPSTSAARSARASTIAEQFDSPPARSSTALRAAGGEPEHLVSLLVYVTDVDGVQGVARASSARSGGAISAAATRRWRCSASPRCSSPMPGSS